MRFTKPNGRQTYKNLQKYRVKWEESCRSKFQYNVKQFFKPYWSHHICYEEIPLVGTRLRLDFFNASEHLAVEVHGAQHGKFNPFFHNNDRGKFLDQIHRDLKKAEWCEINGFKLVEIYAEEEKELLDNPHNFAKFLEQKYEITLWTN